MQTQLLLANELGYLSKQSLDSIFEESTEVYKLINGLYSAIGKRLNTEAACASNELTKH